MSADEFEDESQGEVDARMCLYYHMASGSVEDYAEWPRIREELLTLRPEVVAAVDVLKVARRTLDAVLRDWGNST